VDATNEKEPPTALEQIRVRHFLFAFALSFIGAVLALGVLEGALSVDVPTGLIGDIAIGAPVIGWLGWAVWKQGLSLKALFGPVPTSLYAWGTIGTAALCVYLFGRADLHLIVPFVEHVAPEWAGWYTATLQEAPESTPAILSATVSSVLIAPVVEETLVRGFIFQRWAYAWDRPVGAWLASSVFFSLLHGLTLNANSVVFGVVAVLLYLRVRSLWAPIAMHAALNGITVAGETPVDDVFETVVGAGDQALGWTCLVVSVGILAWFVWYHGRLLHHVLPYMEHEHRGPGVESR
jgi:membrane protease YdiL (CAAX protease family)